MRFLDIDRIWAYMIASILGFFEPIGIVILWMLVFVMADMASGVYASFCNGIIITSHKLQRTVVKTIMYSGSIILLHGLDTYFLTFSDLGLAKLSATLICGIEIYSVFENCYKATGNIVFKVLTQSVKKRLHDNTGVDIHED